MKNIRSQLCLVLMLCGIGTIQHALAQTDDKTLYYVNLNNVREGSIHQVSDFKLNIEYHDVYGTAKEFLFKIYDQQRIVVATLRMDKTAGLNHYSVQLDDVYKGWQQDHVYIGEMKDEDDNLHVLPIRIVAPPELPDPVVNIIANPLKIGCDDLTQSLMEFYGEIKGGRAPYKVNWYVLNKTRTDFLYQPKEELIELAGKTSKIMVDRNPEYNVVLYVKDACGKEDKQILNLDCGKDKEKINTVFVEEFAMPSLIK
jgi:hypothetical protein